jgi:hypothetical protein
MDFKKYVENLEMRMNQFLTASAAPMGQVEKNLEEQVNAATRKRKSGRSSKSFRSRLIDGAERIHASGETGLSLNEIVKYLGIPTSLLNKQAMRTKIRTLSRYLEARGIHTVLVNKTYFNAEISAARSLESVRKLLPIFKATAGLHFIREQNDWFLLGSFHHACLHSCKLSESLLKDLEERPRHASTQSEILDNLRIEVREMASGARRNLNFVNACIEDRIRTDRENTW